MNVPAKCGRHPEFRWYHGQLFALSRKAQGFFCEKEMDMKYEVHMTYAKPDITALVRAIYARRTSGKYAKGLKTVYLVGSIWFLWAGIFGLIQLAGNAEEIIGDTGAGGALSVYLPGVLLILFGAWLLSYVLAPHWLQRQLLWKQYVRKGLAVTYAFGEERLTEQTLVSDQSFDYSLVETVLEDGEHYFLFVDAMSAHILKKQNFIQGDPEEFRTFIEQKTGKSSVQVK